MVSQKLPKNIHNEYFLKNHYHVYFKGIGTHSNPSAACTLVACVFFNKLLRIMSSFKKILLHLLLQNHCNHGKQVNKTSIDNKIVTPGENNERKAH